MKKPPTIAETLSKLSDAELIELLPYIRDENGERVSITELKHCLRETVRSKTYMGIARAMAEQWG